MTKEKIYMKRNYTEPPVNHAVCQHVDFLQTSIWQNYLVYADLIETRRYFTSAQPKRKFSRNPYFERRSGDCQLPQAKHQFILRALKQAEVFDGL